MTKLDKQIKNKMIEIEQWKERAAIITAQNNGERVQASGSQQKMADAICKYMQIESEVSEQVDVLINKYQEIIETIEQLPVVEYDLLHKKYIQDFELVDISIEMNKSYSWVTTVHGRALQRVQRLLDAREKEA